MSPFFQKPPTSWGAAIGGGLALLTVAAILPPFHGLARSSGGALLAVALVYACNFASFFYFFGKLRGESLPQVAFKAALTTLIEIALGVGMIVGLFALVYYILDQYGGF